MKNFMLSILCVFVATGCSGRPTASNTNFEIHTASLIAGTPALGGIALMGSNGSDKFSVGLSYQQAQSFALDLPAGNWVFYAIAWLGSSDGNGGYFPMSGESRCGSSATKIEGESSNVSLTLNAANCNSPTFTNPLAMDAQQPNAFDEVILNSCLNLSSGAYPGAPCQGIHGNAAIMTGESLSARLVLVGQSNFGAQLSSLVSKCGKIDVNNPPYLFSGIIANTKARLPVGGNVAFPLAIHGYENLDCNGQDEESPYASAEGEVMIYAMPDGIAGNQGVARAHFFENNGTFLMYADNHIGGATSVFAVSSQPILPTLSCGHQCFDTATEQLPQGNPGESQRLQIRDTVWRMTGSKDGKDPSDLVDSGTGATPAQVSINNTTGSGEAMINISAAEPGAHGNMPIHFIPISETSYVNCSGNGIAVHFNNGGETAQNLANLIQASCGGLVFASSTGPGATDLLHWNGLNNFLVGGSDNYHYLIPQRRHEGEYNRIRRILLGAIGVVLYQHGITDQSKLCTQNVTINFNVPGKGMMSAKLGNASAQAHFPDFTLDPLAKFQRRLVIASGGVDDEAFYFNCNAIEGDEPSVWAYVSRENYAGQTREQQIFWRLNPAGVGFIESTQYSPHQGDDNWSYSKFELIDPLKWYLWHYGAHENINQNHYERIIAKRDEPDIYGHLENDPLDTNITPGFAVVNWQHKWDMSTGAGDTASGISVEPPHGPSILPSYSVQDLFYGANFWPFSY